MRTTFLPSLVTLYDFAEKIIFLEQEVDLCSLSINVVESQLQNEKEMENISGKQEKVGA